MIDPDIQAIEQRFEALKAELSRIKADDVTSVAETTEIIGRAIEEMKLLSEMALAKYLHKRNGHSGPFDPQCFNSCRHDKRDSHEEAIMLHPGLCRRFENICVSSGYRVSSQEVIFGTFGEPGESELCAVASHFGPRRARSVFTFLLANRATGKDTRATAFIIAILASEQVRP